MAPENRIGLLLWRAGTVYRSFRWGWMERSKYTFSLLLSLASSSISAVIFLLNASFRNTATEYGVDFITYMGSSVVISAMLMRVSTRPTSFKISLLGDPTAIMLGEVLFGIFYNMIMSVPPIIALYLLGLKFKIGFNTLYILLCVISGASLYVLISTIDNLFPGSPLMSAVYNAINLLTSGIWFTPRTLGAFFPLSKLTPQFWIGELARYAVLGKSITDPSLASAILILVFGFSLTISSRLAVEVGRRGGFT